MTMNKRIVAGVFGLAIITVCVVVTWFDGFPQSQVASAQKTKDPEVDRQKREWDKGVTEEKLQRVRIETEIVRQSMVERVKDKFSKYGEPSSRTYDPAGAAIGRRGQSGFKLDWKRGDTFWGMHVTFFFSKEEAEKMHLKQTEWIAMGERFRPPEIFGTDAVLVKNVTYNKSMTWVALHFRKGRLNISCNMQNSFKSNIENENELLKIMNEIYPLLIAKENFDDV